MPRITKAQIGRLLADYDAANNDRLKAEKRADELKAQIRDLDPKEGAYGDMTFSWGKPREILDQPKAREIIKAAGLKVPVTMTTAPIVVKPVVK
jgi:hypothetical protein